MRRRRANAPACRGDGDRFAQRGMLREAEIVIAREVEETFSIDPNIRAIDGFDRAQPTQQRMPRAFGVPWSKAIEQRGTRHAKDVREGSNTQRRTKVSPLRRG